MGENPKPKTPFAQHFHDYHGRKIGAGEVYTLEYQEDVDRKTYNHSAHPRDFKIPKIDFPKFNGKHPRDWKERCEKYFSMYNLPVHLWVPFATLNFENNASLWLQTYEAQHTIKSWPDLCVAVDQKFGRDLYQNYMRDILSIKQTSDVLEYAARFEQAKHRVLVHNRNIDDVYFVQKFLDGLKYNISNAIALHKPRTVDAALSLALMQEEMLEASRRFSSRTKEGSRFSSRSVTAHAPVGVLGTPPADQTVSEKSTGKPRWDDKLAALRSARRAKGLCMKCGEPYSPQHRCHKQVPLHVLEEILELAQVENSAEAKSTTSGSDTKEELLSLSYNAAEGT
jgi:hypothetical protein